MKLRKHFVRSVGIGMGLAVVACGPTKKVERVSESSVTDVSDKWNDTDSRLVSAEMIRDCLQGPWLERATKKKKGAPVVIVQTIRNKTSEHIATGTFTKDLERALINDGRVDFVASKTERDELREERGDQAEHASDDSMKGPGKELGADYALQGSIQSIVQQDGGTRVKFYQVNLELISLEDNRKAWIGDKKIKKVINQAGASW
jgi:penicillin-binding protein activator